MFVLAIVVCLLLPLIYVFIVTVIFVIAIVKGCIFVTYIANVNETVALLQRKSIVIVIAGRRCLRFCSKVNALLMLYQCC